MKSLLLWGSLALLTIPGAWAQAKWQKIDKDVYQEVYMDICLDGLGHIKNYDDRQECAPAC